MTPYFPKLYFPKLLLADLDGVVIDSEFDRDKDKKDFFAERGITYDRDRIKPMLAGKGIKSICTILKDIYGLPESTEELAALMRHRIRDLYRNHIKFVPGAREALEKVMIPKGAASGCDQEFYDLVNTRLHITELFNGHVYLSRIVAREKPEADIIIYAAGRFGISPKECAYIGDSPNDIIATQRAGGFPIAFTRTFGKEALYRQFGDSIMYVDSWEDPILQDLFFP